MVSVGIEVKEFKEFNLGINEMSNENEFERINEKNVEKTNRKLPNGKTKHFSFYPQLFF